MDTLTSNKMSQQRWLQGVSRAVPIVLGYMPIGIAFGVLARKAQLSALNTLLMSILVYAGSAQLIAVGLLAAEAPALSIVLTTLVVNLRHVLMSASLSPFLKRWHKLELAAFAYELTDETFAVHSVRFPVHGADKPQVFALNVTAQSAWVFGTWLGVVAGQLIADVEPLALDYALPAMFIALLVLQIRNRLQIAVALLSGIASIGFLLLGLGQWSVITATVLGATIGVGLEKWTKR